MLRSLSLLLIGVLALAGCDTLPTRTTSSAELSAEADFARGDFARAAETFLQAADQQRSQADRLRLRAAEAWREEGDLARSAAIVQQLNARRLGDDERWRLGLLQAEIALSQGRADHALELLDGLWRDTPGAYQARRLELQARAAAASDNPLFAASLRAELEALLPEHERLANARQIADLLQQVDDHSLAIGAAAIPHGHPAYAHAARELGRRGLPLPRPLVAGTDPLLDNAGAGYRAFRQIALILPLDGPLRAAASAVRDGFIAAYQDEPRDRPRLRILAVDGSPEAAVEAYHAALDGGADLVVGPLGREAASAVREANLDRPVPWLALNRIPELAAPPGSLSFALLPEEEGAAVANRIMRRDGQRALVVAGSDEYGQRVMAAFGQRLEQQAGRIVGVAQLPADSPDYSGAIARSLQQAGARAVDPDGDTRIEENRVEVDADAIFFTGRADEARLLVPQLRIAGIYDLPIYASSRITVGTGNARLDRELDGIEFTEAPWLFEPRAGLPAREALSGLQTAQGSSARLFAFGLDAFHLIGRFHALRRDPGLVIEAATGDLRSDGFGQIVRTPGWAQFRGGRVQPARESGLISEGLQFKP